MNSKQFQRRKENFTCQRCGNAATGDGYTNHCSACLWSKHVDHNPGDRSAYCGGLMRPIEVVLKSAKYRIVHCCLKCGHKKINNSAPADSLAELVKLCN